MTIQKNGVNSFEFVTDLFIEYVFAMEDIKKQQDRINAVAQKIVDNNIDLSALSNHFEYSKEHGLLYKMLENSMPLAVQNLPKKTVSFSEALVDFEIAEYSYQEKENFIKGKRDEAKAFLKDFVVLEENVNRMTEKKLQEVSILPGTSIKSAMSTLKELSKETGNICFAKFNERIITSDMSFNDAYIKCVGFPFEESKKETVASGENVPKTHLSHTNTELSNYLEMLQQAFKTNGVTRCYCPRPFENNSNNRLYIVSPESIKPDTEFISLLSEKCCDYTILNKVDRNIDMDFYTLYTDRLGILTEAVDWYSDKAIGNKCENEDKEDFDR